MPIKGARYRHRRIRGGKQRLAFKDSKVVEVKTMKGKRAKTKRLNPKRKGKQQKSFTFFDKLVWGH